MQKCNGCGAQLGPQLTHCPVCGKFITDTPEASAVSYPRVRKKFDAQSIVLNFQRWMWIGVLICVAVNLYTGWGDWEVRHWWCIYVVVSALALQMCLFRPLRHMIFHWTEGVLQMLVALAYPLFIDWITDGVVSWSVTWIMPILLAAIAVALGVWLSIRRRDPGNLLLMELLVSVLSVVVMILGFCLFDRTTLIAGYTVVPAFVGMLTSVAIFLFFALFKFRTFIRALWKRFHI